MKTTFYIVRHGKTLFNILERFQGWCDSPLVQEGIDGAKKAHDDLIDVDFVKAASSTCERAIDTMEYIIGDRNTPRIYCKNLREVYFGNKEGAIIPFAEPSKEQDDIGYKFCGGENKDEAGQRFMQCLKEIAVEGNMLIVSHGAVILYLISTLYPDACHYVPNELVPNASITVVELDNNEFKLVKLPERKEL